jgi:hypothetical protein
MKLFVVLTALILSAPAYAETAVTPDSVVQSFFKTKTALNPGGLPSQEELKEIATFLSGELVDLLNQARAKELKCMRATPKNMKPPLWEGAVFAGSTEGATRLTKTIVRSSKNKATVSVDLEHIDAHFPIGHRYRVSSWGLDAKLVRSGRRWTISDIVYSNGDSLHKLLLAYRARDCGA